MTDRLLLEVVDLKKHFPIKRGFVRRVVGHVKAVDGVSFSVGHGEVFGLLGESGCGKSTTAKLILRGIEPTEGSIRFRFRDGQVIDINSISASELRAKRREFQMVFQDPYSSLNPRMTVKDILSEPLTVHRIVPAERVKDRVAELLSQVDLQPDYMSRYPHAFSGGQRQRIAIARALAPEPRLLVCDEAVSALDVSVQAQVLNLLQRLQRELDLTYLFISHDLSVVRHICDRLAVMYVGKLVEVAQSEELFDRPYHPYSEALLSAVPKVDPRLKRDRIILRGEVPNPASPPAGCHFHPRCGYAQEVCRTDAPALREVGETGRMVACHFAHELTLRGIQRLQGRETSRSQ